MRRPPLWVVVVGVFAAGTGGPARAREADGGFWVTVAAGAAGSADPSDTADFWFDSPHAPPVAVTRFTGGGGAQAETAGGTTIFSGAATPILLPTADGYATLASSDVPAPAGALGKFAGKARASGAPQDAPGPVPADSTRLSVGLGEKAADGSQALKVTAADPSGAVLGEGTVTVRDGDWWVIGLGPASAEDLAPVTEPVVTDDGGLVVDDTMTTSTPVPVPAAPSGAVTTPEPGTVVLLGAGGVAAAGWRRVRRR